MSDYISLQKAAHLCSYSQEYLSLRARQKKLKALKLGRNWVTTKEWLQEYIAKSETYKKSLVRKRGFAQASPPTNIPVYALDADLWEDDRPEEVAQQEVFKRKLQFAAAFAMVVALALWGVLQGQEDILQRANEIQQSALMASASDVGQEYLVWIRSLFFQIYTVL